MPLYTALGFAVLPLIGGFMMFVLKDPELARKVGLISTKAQILAGTADWPGYLNFMAEMTTMGGLILFGLVGAWVFGREYADRTIVDLLALPTPRATIVLGKFIVIAAWSLALTVVNLVIGLVVGLAIGLPEPAAGTVWQGMGALAISALLTIVIITPTIFLANIGHGYLLPLGITMLVLILGQVSNFAGWSEYFPWAIPAAFAQAASKHSGFPGIASYIILLLASSAGIAGTFLWWDLADETH
jgi:ABC-2 type transport system permease protein